MPAPAGDVTVMVPVLTEQDGCCVALAIGAEGGTSTKSVTILEVALLPPLQLAILQRY